MAGHTKLHASEHHQSGVDELSHNDLAGLDIGDPHTQYLKVDGTRAMSGDLDMGANAVTNVGNVDGVDVSAHAAGTAKAQHGSGLGDHDHQSAGAEGGKLDHGAALDGLSDDDHPQYHDGSLAYTGDLDMGSNKITGLATPGIGTDAATKAYVDAAAQGLDWQDSVIDKDLTSPPGSPSEGDRYITMPNDSAAITSVDQGSKEFVVTGDVSGNISAGDHVMVFGSTGNDGPYTVSSVSYENPNTSVIVNETIPDATGDGSMAWCDGGWTDVGPYNIADYNGSSWDGVTAEEGMATWVEDEDALYVFTGWGASQGWVKFGSTLDHGSLNGLADDDHTQYLLVDGSRAMSGALDMGSQNITSVGTVDGVDVSAHDHSGAGQGGTVDHADLGNLQGGDVAEYYHLTSAEHTGLTEGGDASTYHHHDGRYYQESEFTETDQDAVKPVKTQANGHLDHTLVKEIYHTAKGAGEPTPSEGEVVIWYEDSNTAWLLYGTDTGVAKVELTV